MLPPSPARSLAVALFNTTIQDAKGTRKCDRPAAVAWFASDAASFWFDVLGLDQTYFLEKTSWRAWAREVLPDVPDGPTRDVILSGLDLLS